VFGYDTYDRRPQVDVHESPARSIGGAPLSTSEELQRSLPRTERERRSIFYDALPVALSSISAGAPGQSMAAAPDMSATAAMLSGAYASDYQKQNMNALKEEFLLKARAPDFESYLPSLYLPPIDPLHEIKAGTFIPFTLITAIHSDLPGPIEAQVIENVYDTYSGRNILIPRGTRLHGDYSSGIAFGQNRVLIVWQRMTLPNGVSVNLQGMQGLDLRGMAGLADKVDYHITELISAIGISTVFDIGKAAAITALSTVDVLKDIGTVLAAEGSITKSTDSAIQQVVTAYANKLLNQQPTITIREGNRGNIFVSKDIILPAYGVW
jgi:type IV secretion system protein VirB10